MDNEILFSSRENKIERDLCTCSCVNIPPKAQTQAKTKKISYHSFGQSDGVFVGLRRQLRRRHKVCTWEPVVTGVTCWNLPLLVISTQFGKYLSNKTCKLFRSEVLRFSSQLATYLKLKLSSFCGYFCV